MVSLPFQVLMPRGRTHEQDQPTHPAARHIRPRLRDPNSTPLPKPFPIRVHEVQLPFLQGTEVAPVPGVGGQKVALSLKQKQMRGQGRGSISSAQGRASGRPIRQKLGHLSKS